MKTIMFILLSCAVVAASDWPRFRGPNGSGISDATTIPLTWTEPDYLWKITLPGTGHSSPVVVGSRLFVTCADEATAQQIILCIDVATGRILWRRDFPSKPFRHNKDNSYASPTPAADAHGVVVTWTTPEHVILLALDNNGRELWMRDFGPYVGAHGSGNSPILAGSFIVFDNSQEDPAANPAAYTEPNLPKQAGKSFVVAVDRQTGVTRWQLDRLSGQAAYATPCIRHGNEVILCSTKHGFSGIDLASGKVNWEIQAFDRRVVSSPVLHGDLIINGCGGGGAGFRYFAVRPEPAPTLAYRIEKPVPYVPTAVVKNGRLFLWGDAGTVVCADANNGQVLWRERIQGAFYSSPVWVCNRLYNISKSGDVFVIAAADKFELLSRIGVGEKSYATLAVAGETLFLRTTSRLFAVKQRN